MPTSNARLGSGIADLVSLEQACMTISIGVDGAASNEAADMLSETHAACYYNVPEKGCWQNRSMRVGYLRVAEMLPSIEDIIRWGTAAVQKF